VHQTKIPERIEKNEMEIEKEKQNISLLMDVFGEYEGKSFAEEVFYFFKFLQ
jgi:hypothetical protein